MTQGFDEWKNDYGLEFEPNYSKETEADCKAAYKAGAASRQAEIDELQKRLDMYERQGYKLVPVEPTWEMINEGENACYGDDEEICKTVYKAMIGAVE